MDMKRRALLKRVGGVGAVGYGTYRFHGNVIAAVGVRCGPGETPMGELAHNSGNRVRLQGTVTEYYEFSDGLTSWHCSDGTGRVEVNGEPLPDIGQCMEIDGEVSGCAGAGCPDDLYFITPIGYRPA